MPVSETVLQKAIAADLRDRMVRYRDLLGVHIPNEGKRSKRQGRSLKKQGMVSGAPDLVIWLHRGHIANGWPAVVAIELKTVTGTVSDNQTSFSQRLQELGHPWHVVMAATEDEAVGKVRSLLPPARAFSTLDQPRASAWPFA